MGKLIALFFFLQSIASLVIAECACASLIFASFIDVLSLVCVDPKFLKWSTSSSGFPFIQTLVDGLGLMLLTRMLLASELVSMPYTVDLFSSLSVSCFSCSSLPHSFDVVSERQVAKSMMVMSMQHFVILC